jgi:nicotinamide phosphoribosyltransferase
MEDSIIMTTFTDNICIMSDGYKWSHAYQYPGGTEYVYSYIESRGGIWDRICYFGLQMFRDRILTNPVTHAMVDEAVAMSPLYGVPFFEEGWRLLVDKHGGRLPVEIRAIDEGMVVPTGTPLVTIVNTDPEFFWLTSFLETALLRAIWYPTTVATNSYMCRQMIMDGLVESSDDPQGQIPFKLHDFGARGVSSGESAAIGGIAHLVNFRGTDTLEALVAGRRFYADEMPGNSISAMEHSTVTSFGRSHEAQAYRNMMTKLGGRGVMISAVSDSYDIYNAVSNIWGVELKQEVLDSGTVVVVRPDSGDPTMVPVEILQRLDAAFGHTVNSKGFRVLNPAVRIIQGDGITHKTLLILIRNVLAAGYSLDNIAFGMGGGLLQIVNRDDLKFAMKCCAARINGEWIDVYKDPVGDHSKRSKRGRLSVVRIDGQIVTVAYGAEGDLLKRRFLDGLAVGSTTLAEVRDRAAA